MTYLMVAFMIAVLAVFIACRPKKRDPWKEWANYRYYKEKQ